MVFRSKIDLWLILVLLAAMVVPLVHVVAALRDGSNWIPHAGILAFMACTTVWLLAATKYTVSEGTVVVQSGPFRWSIPTESITRISPSRSLLSSPALSLDRLRIEYEQGRKSLLVSPKDQQAFLQAVESAISAA